MAQIRTERKESIMAEYKNIMENLVEDEFERAKGSLNCCTCEACRNDIIAYALNQLPPKYVATRKGEVYSRALILGFRPSSVKNLGTAVISRSFSGLIG